MINVVLDAKNQSLKLCSADGLDMVSVASIIFRLIPLQKLLALFAIMCSSSPNISQLCNNEQISGKNCSQEREKGSPEIPMKLHRDFQLLCMSKVLWQENVVVSELLIKLDKVALDWNPNFHQAKVWCLSCFSVTMSYRSKRYRSVLLPVSSLVPWHGIGWVVYLVLCHSTSIVIDYFLKSLISKSISHSFDTFALQHKYHTKIDEQIEKISGQMSKDVVGKLVQVWSRWWWWRG